MTLCPIGAIPETADCLGVAVCRVPSLACREKMPFHHVTAGLLYKGNYLNRSLSAGSDSEQLANISVEELDERGLVCTWSSVERAVLCLLLVEGSCAAAAMASGHARIRVLLGMASVDLAPLSLVVSSSQASPHLLRVALAISA
ncbi:Calcium-binding protein 8 [Galemys pyrenaicus]|uniref:Calcium-binding protein 8 n=1 Tax=Galemys pyrenaicus TaxID=202257 RepID=A0A8J5ZTU2_GALPY|nr:Calcium-binding protein 8 [Galemys pyrenaicus]